MGACTFLESACLVCNVFWINWQLDRSPALLCKRLLAVIAKNFLNFLVLHRTSTSWMSQRLQNESRTIHLQQSERSSLFGNLSGSDVLPRTGAIPHEIQELWRTYMTGASFEVWRTFDGHYWSICRHTVTHDDTCWVYNDAAELKVTTKMYIFTASIDCCSLQQHWYMSYSWPFYGRTTVIVIGATPMTIHC